MVDRVWKLAPGLSGFESECCYWLARLTPAHNYSNAPDAHWFHCLGKECTNFTYVKMGFPGDAEVKNLPFIVEEARGSGSVPGLGRSPREGNRSPLQYSCLEKSMDRGALWATVHGNSKRWTRLSVHVCGHTHK